MTMTRTFISTTLAVALGTAACWSYDPSHCASRGGDGSCAAGQYCDACQGAHHGCVDVQPIATCYAPGVQASSGSESDSAQGTTLEADTTDETTSSTGIVDSTTGSTGIVGCADDANCTNDAAPFCGPDGACVTCEALADPNGACAAADGNTPVCADGTCVQCTLDSPSACAGQTPVCVENSCVACAEHFQCPDSACHLDGDEVGSCFDVADVITIANVADLSNALGRLGAGGQAVMVLSPGTYGVTISIGGSAEVAVLGAEEGTPVLSGNGSRAVDVFGSAIVYLANVQVDNNAGDGVACSGTSVWLDDASIENNPQVGLTSTGGCGVHSRRSVFANNSGGGINCVAGELALENSAIGLNGNAFASSVGGVRVDGTAVTITYSSIVANEALLDPRGSLSCTGGATGEVRNSIVVGGGSSVDACDAIAFVTSAVDDPMIGGTTVDVGPAMNAWFVALGLADFHLTMQGRTAMEGIAVWQDGDPVTDIDGDPIDLGALGYPGYDQP
jgi:hypothetical protein